jgi:antitoxin CcdA
MDSTLAIAPRKATNVTLDPQTLARARELKINLSEAAEQGVTAAISKKMAELWTRENHAALESSNVYVEKLGLPLAKYRNF